MKEPKPIPNNKMSEKELRGWYSFYYSSLLFVCVSLEFADDFMKKDVQQQDLEMLKNMPSMRKKKLPKKTTTSMVSSSSSDGTSSSSESEEKQAEEEANMLKLRKPPVFVC